MTNEKSENSGPPEMSDKMVMKHSPSDKSTLHSKKSILAIYFTFQIFRHFLLSIFIYSETTVKSKAKKTKISDGASNSKEPKKNSSKNHPILK